MKANELRIGNWVLIKGTITHKLITAYDIIDLIEHRSDFSPIPLTNEVMVKCGFGTNNEGWWWKNGLEINIDDEEVEGFGYCEIKHLHQLQNLYFALTGKEIEYKP